MHISKHSCRVRSCLVDQKYQFWKCFSSQRYCMWSRFRSRLVIGADVSLKNIYSVIRFFELPDFDDIDAKQQAVQFRLSILLSTPISRTAASDWIRYNLCVSTLYCIHRALTLPAIIRYGVADVCATTPLTHTSKFIVRCIYSYHSIWVFFNVFARALNFCITACKNI